MIRHKATGTELKWRHTWGYRGAPNMATAWALSSADDRVTPVYAYTVSRGSIIYSTAPGGRALFSPMEPQTKESMLAKAVELGVVEIVEEDPPKDYDAIHRDEEESDRRLAEESDWLLEDVRALAIRLFLAGHDDAASALRRLL